MPEEDLYDLADVLAIQLSSWMGGRVYRLQRGDIAELIAPFVDDITPEDQHDVTWMIWHLFQDARDIEMQRLSRR